MTEKPARQDNTPEPTPGLFPQDPTACHEPPQTPAPTFPTGHQPSGRTSRHHHPRQPSCRCSTH